MLVEAYGRSKLGNWEETGDISPKAVINLEVNQRIGGGDFQRELDY